MQELTGKFWVLSKYNGVSRTKISNLSQSKQNSDIMILLSWEDHGGLKGRTDMKQDAAT